MLDVAPNGRDGEDYSDFKDLENPNYDGGWEDGSGGGAAGDGTGNDGGHNENDGNAWDPSEENLGGWNQNRADVFGEQHSESSQEGAAERQTRGESPEKLRRQTTWGSNDG